MGHHDPQWDKPWYDTDNEPRWMGGITKWVLFTVVLGLLVTAVFVATQYLTADTRGKVAVREQTQGNGTYRIAQYEKFYDLCGNVQALEDQLHAMRGDRSLPKDQRAANVLALTNQRNTLIRQYNTDSRKAGTQAQFKASDLPAALDPTQESTSCTA